MTGLSAISLFCQDVRREEGGVETIIGVMPDNIKVNSRQTALNKLVVYTRINFLTKNDPEEISIVITAPDGKELSRVDVERETIEKAMHPGKNSQKEIAGIKSQFSSFNVLMGEEGCFRVVVKSKKEEILSGIMNVVVEEK